MTDSFRGIEIVMRPSAAAGFVLAVGVTALVWAWLMQRTALAVRPGPLLCRSAFTARECDAIAKVFLAQPVEQDMREDDGIRRTNHWDASKVRRYVSVPAPGST